MGLHLHTLSLSLMEPSPLVELSVSLDFKATLSILPSGHQLWPKCFHMQRTAASFKAQSQQNTILAFMYVTLLFMA